MLNWRPENSDVTIGRGKKAALYATPLFLCVAVVELGRNVRV